jgi:hypothetical protein
MAEMISLTLSTVTLYTDAPKGVGQRMDFEVKLPEGIRLRSFTINGTVTGCKPVGVSRSGGYKLEMSIGDLSPTNKKILEAYVDFVEREKTLREIRPDFKGLQEACNDFGEKLKQLRETAEEMKSNVRGALELIRRNAAGKTTIH